MPNIRFIDSGGATFPVDAESGTSVMRAAVDAGVPGIVGECGGSMICGTCHVQVDPAWADRIGPADADEAEMLAFAEDVQPTSRLSCQITVGEDLDGLVVHVPARMDG